MAKKCRIKIPQQNKIRAILQKEIESICPFCKNGDVGYFEVHHIDENPSNNYIENLILVCPTCHSKITRNDLSKEEVIRTKKSSIAKIEIECASVTIDKNCSWESYDNIPCAFIERENKKNPFPTICFSLINHTYKTILLKEIQLMAKHLLSGLTGLPEPRILNSIKTYRIEIPRENEVSKHLLIDEIEVPPQRAFKFKIMVLETWNHSSLRIKGRKVLIFTFVFNSDKAISQTVYLNCKSENDKLTLRALH